MQESSSNILLVFWAITTISSFSNKSEDCSCGEVQGGGGVGVSVVGHTREHESPCEAGLYHVRETNIQRHVYMQVIHMSIIYNYNKYSSPYVDDFYTFNFFRSTLSIKLFFEKKKTKQNVPLEQTMYFSSVFGVSFIFQKFELSYIL